MFPDPITPRSYPELLAKPDYDPFKVMPGNLPPAPRIFTTAAQLQRARQRLDAGNPIDTECFKQLISLCKIDEPLPALKLATGPIEWGLGTLTPPLKLAFYNALAFKLGAANRHRDRALEAMRLAAHAAVRKNDWSGDEHHEAGNAARAYDLLVSDGLSPADDNLFRSMLRALMSAMECATHRMCNNHNSMQMTGRLPLAVALEDIPSIHDTLYGHQHNGQWRYGLIHCLRHDFLADGTQWEGAAGYHMLVLMMVCECFTIMEHLGVDLWHRQWPSLMQNDSQDEHRGWGPKGARPLLAAFDAMLYMTFPNGDYSLLHDQILGNIRGTGVWGPIFNQAYEKFRLPRHAWVLRQINRGCAATANGPLPRWFMENRGATDFVRIEARDYPEGEYPLTEDRQFSLTGRHVSGCSLLPEYGLTILRSDVLDLKAPSASLYWGPHSAGHRSPAALHLEIHAFDQRISNAPHVFKDGYGDPRHLTWNRSTIAHNTVTVDQYPMFPYDFESESLWECDRWRDTLSDGKLEQFQPEGDFKVARASNDNVYAGVLLDRTVVVTRGFVMDLFRVTADRPRLLDWAIHLHGEFSRAGEPVDLGQNRGYRHMTDARVHPRQNGSDWTLLPFQLGDTRVHGDLWLGGASEAQLITAQDEPVDGRSPIGDSRPPQARTAVIVRRHAATALFVSIWGLDPHQATPRGGHVSGKADADVTVQLGKDQRWIFPLKGNVRREPSQT
ncbi:MAG: heparinase II/III family protein [Phycisphaeraceae bacterium]|nr:heparinase II/III family protein [Phycisphaeraceae bacterium]